VVEVAEGLVAEARAAAAATVGVDVAALIGIAVRIVGVVVHDYPLPVKTGQNLDEIGLRSGYPLGCHDG
jgi:hypothetical protein